jgi:hypothetical protein
LYSKLGIESPGEYPVLKTSKKHSEFQFSEQKLTTLIEHPGKHLVWGTATGSRSVAAQEHIVDAGLEFPVMQPVALPETGTHILY